MLPFLGVPYSEEKQEYIIPRPHGDHKWSYLYLLFTTLKEKVSSAMILRIIFKVYFNTPRIAGHLLSLRYKWFFIFLVFLCTVYTGLVQSSW